MTRQLMMFGTVIAAAAATVAAQSADLQKIARLRNPAALNEKAPDTFKANFDTSKGSFTITVTRSLAIRSRSPSIRRACS